MTLDFIPGFKLHTHKQYITDTVIILFINILGGLLVPDSIIFQVVSISALIGFIRYIYH